MHEAAIMTILSLEMPDAAEELAHWLELQLVSDDLGRLVAELRAVSRDEPAAAPPLTELLGPALDDVLDRGLIALPEANLRRFFRHPHRLLDLQWLVLEQGRRYWSEVSRPESLIEASRASAQGVQAKLSATRARRVNWTRLVSVAALVLLAFGVGWWWPRPAVGPNFAAIGWNRPEAFAMPEDRPAFRGRLARLTQEWRDSRPETVAELSARLIEIRLGCARLLEQETELRPLGYGDLLDACRRWSAKFDADLAELRGHPDRFITVRAHMEETLQKMIEKLSETPA